MVPTIQTSGVLYQQAGPDMVPIQVDSRPIPVANKTRT